MKTVVIVDPGICGFQSRVHAESEDTQNVTFKIAGGCEKVRAFAAALAGAGAVDGYAEIGAGSDGVVLSVARAAPHARCLWPCSRPCRWRLAWRCQRMLR